MRLQADMEPVPPVPFPARIRSHVSGGILATCQALSVLRSAPGTPSVGAVGGSSAPHGATYRVRRATGRLALGTCSVDACPQRSEAHGCTSSPIQIFHLEITWRDKTG